MQWTVKAYKIALYAGLSFYLILSVSCFIPGNTGEYNHNTQNNIDTVIVADHTVVAKYADIPAYWIAQVKKMWINIVGESHSYAYRRGLELLAANDSRFAAVATESGSPESATNAHLRSSRLRRSQYSNWTEATGEADFWTTASGITSVKNHITYCETNNLHITFIGFGWCWDMVRGTPSPNADSAFGCHWYGSTSDGTDSTWWGLDANDSPINCQTFCQQLDDYNDFCRAQGYTTRFIFTTGTIDGYEEERGYQSYLKNEYIRNYIKTGNSRRILFDYADILCYNDSGAQNTRTWNGHTYPFIHDNNLLPTNDVGHIGANGALRLAKAQWWLLARLAGWDGQPAK